MTATLFIFLLLSLSFSIVSCSFFDKVADKFQEAIATISQTFYDIGKKLKSFFVPVDHEVKKHDKEDDDLPIPLFIDRPIYHNMKMAFSDFIDLKGDGKAYDFMQQTNTAFLLATPQLAHWHGREMESHVIQTKDDYFLTVHRLTTNSDLQANRTVLLHHGLLGSSTDWILLGPTKSLPYILSDAGFDVWITNARGNYYSRDHLFMETTCLDFWKFSWQEIGEFDLPAVIDHIRRTKNLTESINFIGHSMGATALMVLLSTLPMYNEYLRMGILIAPLVYMDQVKGPIRVMTGMSEDVIKLLGNGEFLPNRKVPSWMTSKYCKGPKILCNNPLLFLSGLHQDRRWNASFVARLLYHVPAGGSTNTLLHYMQVSHSGKFHRFNQPNDEFSLSNVTVPIALISASNDWLATVPNVLKLYFALLNPIDHFIIKNSDITHTDMVWGIDANILVFGKVVEYLEKGLIWNMEEENEV